MSKIAYEKAANSLEYRDGRLFWCLPTIGRRIKGSEAGSVNKHNGLRYVEIDGKNYMTSHLVWLLHNKKHPERNISYVNGDRSDNRIENLKLSGDVEITQDFLHHIFEYKDGLLIWKNKPTEISRIKIGDVAGFVSSQKQSEYRYIKIAGDRYKAANLIWMYHYGKWPNDILDHINHKKDDDRIENLREVTQRENARNRSKGKYGKYGMLGIHKSGDKFTVRIGENYSRIYVGQYDTLEEAKTARSVAEKMLGYHKNHGQ